MYSTVYGFIGVVDLQACRCAPFSWMCEAHRIAHHMLESIK